MAAAKGERRRPLRPAKTSSGSAKAEARKPARTAEEKGRIRKSHVAGKKTEWFGSAAIGIPQPIVGFQSGEAPWRIASENANRSGAKKKPKSRA